MTEIINKLSEAIEGKVRLSKKDMEEIRLELFKLESYKPFMEKEPDQVNRYGNWISAIYR